VVQLLAQVVEPRLDVLDRGSRHRADASGGLAPEKRAKVFRGARIYVVGCALVRGVADIDGGALSLFRGRFPADVSGV
jgi:hypothetical protein